MDKARCTENEILFSRRVDWDMLACTTYKEREVAMGHGPTECHSILSYMVASHGVPRLQTSLFCFDYIWFALYRDVHYCCPSWMMHRFLPGFGSSLLVLAQPDWVLESYRHLATVFRRKGRSNAPFQKFTAIFVLGSLQEWYSILKLVAVLFICEWYSILKLVAVLFICAVAAWQLKFTSTRAS